MPTVEIWLKNLWNNAVISIYVGRPCAKLCSAFIYNGPCLLLTANNVIKPYCLSSVQYLSICIYKQFFPCVYAKREHDPNLLRAFCPTQTRKTFATKRCGLDFSKSILGLADLAKHLINSFDERQISFLVFSSGSFGGEVGWGWCGGGCWFRLSSLNLF